jgi:hypothetical protein
MYAKISWVRQASYFPIRFPFYQLHSARHYVLMMTTYRWEAVYNTSFVSLPWSAWRWKTELKAHEYILRQSLYSLPFWWYFDELRFGNSEVKYRRLQVNSKPDLSDSCRRVLPFLICLLFAKAFTGNTKIWVTIGYLLCGVHIYGTVKFLCKHKLCIM